MTGKLPQKNIALPSGWERDVFLRPSHMSITQAHAEADFTGFPLKCLAALLFFGER